MLGTRGGVPEKDDRGCPKRATEMPTKNDMSSPDENSKDSKEREMHGTETHESRTRRPRRIARHGVVSELNTLSRLRVEHEDRPLRCVSSGYMGGSCSCGCVVPAGVVVGVWARELDRSPSPTNRFFRFAWRGEEWLAFGLADGRIRGVYCPIHRAERDARSAGCEARHPEQPARAAA
jgi:hypothetical protein